jgi:hypothetical protein
MRAILCMLLLWQTCAPHCMPRPICLPYFTSSLCWQTCTSLCMPRPISLPFFTSSLLWQTYMPLCMPCQIGLPISLRVAPLTDMCTPLHAPLDLSAVFHFINPLTLIGVHAIYMFLLLLTYAFSHSHETLKLPLLCPNSSCTCTRHDTNPPWYNLKASCCKEGIPKRFCNNDTMVWIFLTG